MKASTIVSAKADYPIPVISMSTTLKILGVLLVTSILLPFVGSRFQADVRMLTLLGNATLVPYMIVSNTIKQSRLKTKLIVGILLGISFFLLSFLWLYLGILA